MKKKEAITSDLFGCNDCIDCDGSGVIVTDLVFNDVLKIPAGQKEDKCESCNGRGVIDAIT